MRELIDQYIDSKQLAWSPNTLRSERYRLYSVYATLGAKLSPQAVYDWMYPQLKPYTFKTLFIRLVKFYDWLIKTNNVPGPNPFRNYMEDNALLFKNVYKREAITTSFKEAKSRIQTLSEPARSWALHLLFNGARISEAFQGSHVKGKGNKNRVLFNSEFQNGSLITEAQLRAELKKVGLKPHTLRKLFATELVDKGARPEDLCEILGWSSIKTAYYYLQPKKEEELKKLVCSLGE